MADEEVKTGLKPVEIAKVIFQVGAKILEDYEEDSSVEMGEIMEYVQSMFTKLYAEYRD